MVRPRRRLAAGLVIGAVATIAVSVVSAADAGYRIDDGALNLPGRHQGHIYLQILGNPLELGLAAGLAMLVAAGYYGVVRRRARIWAAVAAGACALLLLLVFGADLMLRYMLGESGGSTVASSAQYKVVKYEESPGTAILHVRSRNGLLSYQGAAPVACLIWGDSDVEGWQFEHASLSGNTVKVVAKDGTTWEVRFDPQTLRPANPAGRCAPLSDPAGAD
ncbi:hypothetical protein ACQPZX_38315 [Actinoplanes sp. CA-142083]|uniref:hypothetical protein n=1 Tax=Actinoplanes sp. CA-142083 TaxID=3239903 RepID=UPI003D901BF0